MIYKIKKKNLSKLKEYIKKIEKTKKTKDGK